MSVTASPMDSVLQQLQATAGQAGLKPQPLVAGHGAGSAAAAKGTDFSDALVASLNKINTIQTHANNQAQAFERGDPDISVSAVMIDLQKANLAFDMGVQVRDRLISAYREIMNMQV